MSASAPQLLATLSGENYAAELQRTTIETNTEVVQTLTGLRNELVRLRRGVMDAAGPLGVGIAAVGTAPRSEISDFELTSSQRFGAMQEKYRLLVDEQLICGFQVHVGVSDRDLAIDLAQRVAEHLPVLLALSASSPFWNGHDSGYASVRSLVWQRWPSAGATGPLKSAAEYDELIADLIGTGVIADSKMAYFDIRPSSHAPTLELRICDALPLVDDAVLIAGLFRAAVRMAEIDIENGLRPAARRAPVQRAALWQAARTGLSGDLLSSGAHPHPIGAAEAVRHLVTDLRPALEQFGDWPEVQQLAEFALARGNSSDRQRAAYSRRQSLDDVVELVIDETQTVGDTGSVAERPASGSGLGTRGPDLRARRDRAARGCRISP